MLNNGLLGETLPLYTQMIYIDFLKNKGVNGLVLENNFYLFAYQNFRVIYDFFEGLHNEYKYYFYLNNFEIRDKNDEFINEGSYSNFVYSLSMLETLKLLENSKPSMDVLNTFLDSLANSKCYLNLMEENYNYNYLSSLLENNMTELQKYRKR